MKNYLLFRTEHNFVYYLWNGVNVILIHLPKGVNPDPYYWMGNPNDVPPAKERDQLDSIASAKNKVRIFKLSTRPGIRYYIIERGQFVED